MYSSISSDKKRAVIAAVAMLLGGASPAGAGGLKMGVGSAAADRGAAITGQSSAQNSALTFKGPQVAFAEGGRTFSDLDGANAYFGGACSPQGSTVRLSVTVQGVSLPAQTAAACNQGTWKSAAFPVASFARGIVKVTATATGPGGRVASASTSFNVVNVLDNGAKGDGATDDLAAIKTSITQAQGLDNGIVYVPAGHTYVHSSTFILNGNILDAVTGAVMVKGVELFGGGTGSLLLASDPLHSTIFISGDGARVRNLKLSSNVGSTARDTHPDSTMISPTTLYPPTDARWIYPVGSSPYATHFWIDRVVIDSGASGGIFNLGGRGTPDAYSRITRNQVANTLADAIHNTNGARYIHIEGNSVATNGDDMVAVVSYAPASGETTDPADGLPQHLCAHIQVTSNTLTNTYWGRGVAVVGGYDVQIASNTINVSSAGGIYLNSESNSSWTTYGPENITVTGNTIKGASWNQSAHGSIFVQGRAGQYLTASGIALQSNVILDSPYQAVVLGPNSTNIQAVGNTLQEISVTNPCTATTTTPRGPEPGYCDPLVPYASPYTGSYRNNHGFYLNGTSNVTISGNTLTNVGGSGIWVANTADKASVQILSNTFSGTNRSNTSGFGDVVYQP